MFTIDMPARNENALKVFSCFDQLAAAGFGIRQTFLALEPIAEALWDLVRRWKARGEDEDDLPPVGMSCDPSIDISIKGLLQADGGQELLWIKVERKERFKMWISAYATPDEGFVPFTDSSPQLGIHAADIPELMTFLVLAKLHGGELSCDI